MIINFYKGEAAIITLISCCSVLFSWLPSRSSWIHVHWSLLIQSRTRLPAVTTAQQSLLRPIECNKECQCLLKQHCFSFQTFLYETIYHVKCIFWSLQVEKESQLHVVCCGFCVFFLFPSTASFAQFAKHVTLSAKLVSHPVWQQLSYNLVCHFLHSW